MKNFPYNIWLRALLFIIISGLNVSYSAQLGEICNIEYRAVTPWARNWVSDPQNVPFSNLSWNGGSAVFFTDTCQTGVCKGMPHTSNVATSNTVNAFSIGFSSPTNPSTIAGGHSSRVASWASSPDLSTIFSYCSSQDTCPKHGTGVQIGSHLTIGNAEYICRRHHQVANDPPQWYVTGLPGQMCSGGSSNLCRSGTSCIPIRTFDSHNNQIPGNGLFSSHPATSYELYECADQKKQCTSYSTLGWTPLSAAYSAQAGPRMVLAPAPVSTMMEDKSDINGHYVKCKILPTGHMGWIRTAYPPSGSINPSLCSNLLAKYNSSRQAIDRLANHNVASNTMAQFLSNWQTYSQTTPLITNQSLKVHSEYSKKYESIRRYLSNLIFSLHSLRVEMRINGCQSIPPEPSYDIIDGIGAVASI